MHEVAVLFQLFQFVLKDRTQLALENVALRQQLAVYKRTVKRQKIEDRGRISWLSVMRMLKDWKEELVFVQPATAPAFPFDTVPEYLLRDRDWSNGWEIETYEKALGIEELVSAPRSPWQNPLVERVIGSIRRECLDHIVPLSEQHLLQTLREYVAYYDESRAHQ